MLDRYIKIDELRETTRSVIKRKEEEDAKLRQAHKNDLYNSMRDLVNEYMATSAAKGYYDVVINMENAMQTPCDTEEERRMRLEVLGDVAAELHSRGFKIRFNNQLHITISWEE